VTGLFTVLMVVQVTVEKSTIVFITQDQTERGTPANISSLIIAL